MLLVALLVFPLPTRFRTAFALGAARTIVGSVAAGVAALLVAAIAIAIAPR